MAATVPLIRDRLRDAILSGELAPGDRATQMQLADLLGVSRTPLREALRMLEREGLVLREDNGRLRISSLSVGQLEDLTVMRTDLEVVAVSLTVPRFQHSDHAVLEGWLAQLQRYATVEDWVGIEEPHREFHQMLVSGAGVRITAILGQMWVHTKRYRMLAFQHAADTDWEASAAEHRALVDAFENYDTAAAARCTATHIARTAILIARDVAPETPVPRLHRLLRRYTGNTDARQVRKRGRRVASQ